MMRCIIGIGILKKNEGKIEIYEHLKNGPWDRARNHILNQNKYNYIIRREKEIYLLLEFCFSIINIILNVFGIKEKTTMFFLLCGYKRM